MKLLEAIHRAMVIEEGLQPFRLPSRRSEPHSDMILRVGLVPRSMPMPDVLDLQALLGFKEIVLENLPSEPSSMALEHLVTMAMSDVEKIRIRGGGKLLNEKQLEMLLSNPTLQNMTCFEVCDHPSMTDKLVRRLKRRARGRLEELVLCNTGLTHSGIETAFSRETWTKLETLRLHQGGMIDDDAASLLARGKFPSLKTLDLGNCAISEASIGPITNAESFPKLERVVLQVRAGHRPDPTRFKVEAALRGMGLLKLNHRI